MFLALYCHAAVYAIWTMPRQYWRIFNNWVAAYSHFTPAECQAFMAANAGEACPVVPTGTLPFNDAYRYMDWLLTVPLLCIEIVLVMKLTPAQTTFKATTLGLASALMIILGYPGEMITVGVDVVVVSSLSRATNCVCCLHV